VLVWNVVIPGDLHGFPPASAAPFDMENKVDLGRAHGVSAVIFALHRSIAIEACRSSHSVQDFLD